MVLWRVGMFGHAACDVCPVRPQVAEQKVKARALQTSDSAADSSENGSQIQYSSDIMPLHPSHSTPPKPNVKSPDCRSHPAHPDYRCSQLVPPAYQLAWLDDSPQRFTDINLLV